MGPVAGLEGRGGEIPNIGALLLVFACGAAEETSRFDFSTVKETVGFGG